MTHKNIIFLLLTSFSLLFIACDSKKSNEEVIIVKASNIVKETIAIKGITCVGCETRVEKAITKMEGVVKFKAVSKDNTAILEFDKSKTDLKTVQTELDKLSGITCL
ncbi:MAG: hypothetical protein DRQ78_13530 [Epsilonproteobacteria bacterium]|nr:MAG: hypothetical protein DRQ78_13530 [Campylobacterota bacterium]